VLHRLRVVGALPGLGQLAQRLGVAGPVGQLYQDGVARGPPQPAEVVFLDARAVLAGAGFGDRHPADQLGDPRAEGGAEVAGRAVGVFHHVVQHGRAEDVGVGHACATDQHLERLQQVLQVGRAGGPPLAAVPGFGEGNRPVQPCHGIRRQCRAQPGLSLLPRVPGRERLHPDQLPNIVGVSGPVKAADWRQMFALPLTPP